MPLLTGTSRERYENMSPKMRNFASINRNLDKLMNTKKLIVFLLWAFLPMVIVGLVMHFSGASLRN